jgi:hypothetical protein
VRENEPDNFVLMPNVEKVERRGSALVPLLEFLGTILEFYIEIVRPQLFKKKKQQKALGLWINQNGDVACKYLIINDS